jgi:uncharacterized membrane protein
MEWALFNMEGLQFALRWLHFLGGVSWIGILWYFNFSQGPFMNEVDATVKTAVNSKLSPRTLWYFRWGAMLTVLSGLAILGLRMSVPGGAALATTSWGVTILTGTVLGFVMWFNVWFVIWPRQKKIIAAAQRLPGLAHEHAAVHPAAVPDGGGQPPSPRRESRLRGGLVHRPDRDRGPDRGQRIGRDQRAHHEAHRKGEGRHPHGRAAHRDPVRPARGPALIP